jgi:hypothetical protein
MLGRTPSFPSIDIWQRMSEREQDALIRTIETTRRRRSRLILGLASAGLCAVIAIAAKLAHIVAY